MSRSAVADLLSGATPVETAVTLAGWLRSRRSSKGGFSFLAVHDGSAFDAIQVVADQALPQARSRHRDGAVIAHILGHGQTELTLVVRAGHVDGAIADIAHQRPRHARHDQDRRGDRDEVGFIRPRAIALLAIDHPFFSFEVGSGADVPGI